MSEPTPWAWNQWRRSAINTVAACWAPAPHAELPCWVSESVIRRVVGSREVMSEQLEHLLLTNESPDVTLQVLPFARGAHAAAMGSFMILGGVEPSLDVVYVDIHVGSLFMEKEEELERYRLAFDYLRVQALDMAATSALIKRVLREM
ncbi:DUF5753 domain-containing protein [Streptomyces morookaense]|uniref:DUF5753 domain-containing protein n=1 Tax=Streptomyces morookaense TaxID=1970 RepID=UPI0034D4F260